jgi:hypothetical protein
MDVATVLTSLVSSGIISLGAARWLTTRLIDHLLTKDLKDYQAALDVKLAITKSELDSQVATAKANVDAALRRGVEEYLGDKSAERQYRLDARKRLYGAIGPLRFQLIVACDDFAGRIRRIGEGKQPYATSLKAYFGRSTVFRLLRLFGITELIARQAADADFSVDPSMTELLRFKHESFRCMSSSTIALDHPVANWDTQVEHVFYDRLSMIAAAMIVSDDEVKQARVRRFDEFNDFVSHEAGLKKIQPIPRLMRRFSVDATPILWVRFVALARLCSTFAMHEGPAVGLRPEAFDGPAMLRASSDAFLRSHHDRYCRVLDEIDAALAPTRSG